MKILPNFRSRIQIGFMILYMTHSQAGLEVRGHTKRNSLHFVFKFHFFSPLPPSIPGEFRSKCTDHDGPCNKRKGTPKDDFKEGIDREFYFISPAWHKV